MARNNLTVSRDVYEAILREREELRSTQDCATMNDALASLIGENLTGGRVSRRQAQLNRVDKILRKTLVE